MANTSFQAANTFHALDAKHVYVIRKDHTLWLETGPGTKPETRPGWTSQQVDGNVLAIQGVDTNTVYVLGNDGNLWFEPGPFSSSNVPPAGRKQVDGNVSEFQALDANTAYVDGGQNLWFETGPWSDTNVPPAGRKQVDDQVGEFQALDANRVYVSDIDGILWFETGPWSDTNVPPAGRKPVDTNVHAFQALDANTVFVLGDDGNLWLETGPWDDSNVPPASRQQVDGNVMAFQALDANTLYVLGNDGSLWFETGPFSSSNVPPAGRKPVDTNVHAFQALDANTVFVLGGDGTLWLEAGPWSDSNVPPANRQPIDSNVLVRPYPPVVTPWTSGSNAVLTDQCQALGDVTVTLVVTEDLVTEGNGGFSLQLNAYPMPGVTSVGLPLNWIQFTLYVSNNAATFQWQAWSLGAAAGVWPQGQPVGVANPNQPVPGFSQPNAVITGAPSNQLPKGSSLTIALKTDPSSHGVTQATFTVQMPGAQPKSVPVSFPASIPVTLLGGGSTVVNAQFPISGFQVDLVGPGNSSRATFTSGAGVLKYSVPAGGSLSVQNGGVGAACGQYSGATTGETSNIAYGAVSPPIASPGGAEITLDQRFGLA